MFFLNLSAAEFFALLGALGGIITALYLLDRAKRRKIVSTLRFWTEAAPAQEHATRRRMNDPWSLFLQLISLLLLLLAIAQLQWGSRGARGRDHILLLDTSAWTRAHTAARGERVIDQERALARQVLSSFPARDRVMLVAVDSLATPLTAFTADRSALSKGLQQAMPGWTALDVDHMLSFAEQAQRWSGGSAGEIIYLGPLRAGELPQSSPASLRVIPVTVDGENWGIRRLSAKQVEEEPDTWQATVNVKNYGAQKRVLPLHLRCAGVAFATRLIALAPGEEKAVDYRFATSTGGDLIATLEPADSLPEDNRAVLRVPQTAPLRVAVFTDRPEMLAPLLASNRQIAPLFFAASQYPAATQADVVIIDRLPISPRLSVPVLCIDPPRDHSPLPVKAQVTNAAISSWTSSQNGPSLKSRELRIPSANVFEMFEGDQAVAGVEAGPVVVARPRSKTAPALAVIGFDPESEQTRFQVTIPLLFANLLQWLDPDAFRIVELTAEQAGLSRTILDPASAMGWLRVENENGAPIPYAIRQRSLQLFAAQPTTVKVVSPERERLLSISLPDIGAYEWQIPPGAARGLPSARAHLVRALDIWKWLASLGGVGLLLEWCVFGPGRSLTWRNRLAAKPPVASAGDRELVAR